MTYYTATIQHHSISRARVIKFKAATIAAAKRRAYNEFKGEFLDYIIALDVDSECPQGSWTRRVGDTRRNAWLNWHPVWRA